MIEITSYDHVITKCHIDFTYKVDFGTIKKQINNK